MLAQKYKLRYLPIFYDDLERCALYIANDLLNVKAANDLINEVEKAIIERLPIAESFEPYISKNERKNPYYRIYVKNYVIYYVVINDRFDGKVMEVRRFLHQKQKWITMI